MSNDNKKKLAEVNKRLDQIEDKIAGIYSESDNAFADEKVRKKLQIAYNIIVDKQANYAFADEKVRKKLESNHTAYQRMILQTTLLGDIDPHFEFDDAILLGEVGINEEPKLEEDFDAGIDAMYEADAEPLPEGIAEEKPAEESSVEVSKTLIAEAAQVGEQVITSAEETKTAVATPPPLPATQPTKTSEKNNTFGLKIAGVAAVLGVVGAIAYFGTPESPSNNTAIDSFAAYDTSVDAGVDTDSESIDTAIEQAIVPHEPIITVEPTPNPNPIKDLTAGDYQTAKNTTIGAIQGITKAKSLDALYKVASDSSSTLNEYLAVNLFSTETQTLGGNRELIKNSRSFINGLLGEIESKEDYNANDFAMVKNSVGKWHSTMMCQLRSSYVDAKKKKAVKAIDKELKDQYHMTGKELCQPMQRYNQQR